MATESFDVKVANGEKLTCQAIAKQVLIQVQSIKVAADLHVLQLVGLDVMLGNAWLRSLGKVVTDYNAMSMQFPLGKKEVTLTTIGHKSIQPCEANARV